MIEKNPQEAKIRKGAPKRDPVSYQMMQDIVIPAGTILRATGDDQYTCVVGFGKGGVAGEFIATIKPGIDSAALMPLMRRVTVA